VGLTWYDGWYEGLEVGVGIPFLIGIFASSFVYSVDILLFLVMIGWIPYDCCSVGILLWIRRIVLSLLGIDFD